MPKFIDETLAYKVLLAPPGEIKSMQPKDIKHLIESRLKDSEAIIEGNDGKHFTATVICSQFTGKNRVQKQQLVYATLNEFIANGSLHAISIKTFTPEEWQH
jgi:acid stress-induced BolA-like protein IbaG/YrbA